MSKLKDILLWDPDANLKGVGQVKDRVFHFRATEGQAKIIEAVARHDGRTVSNLLSWIVTKYIEDLKK